MSDKYEQTQMWGRVETDLCMEYLRRLMQRVKTFGIVNMDPNTEKCLNLLAEIYEKREEQLEELERERASKQD